MGIPEIRRQASNLMRNYANFPSIQSIVGLAVLTMFSVSGASADTSDQRLRWALTELAVKVGKIKVNLEIIKGSEVLKVFCLACYGP